MDKNKMLIDATHPEETRVVVHRNGRVEEFDFESAARKLLRGNIYLAKVTRVEPSLQAAFIEYGGNRHGFLAFNEIHPDYYQIPIADREALKQAEAEADAAAEAESEERARRRSTRGRRSRRSEADRPLGLDRGQSSDHLDQPAIDVETGHHSDRAEPLAHDQYDERRSDTYVEDDRPQLGHEGDEPSHIEERSAVADQRSDYARADRSFLEPAGEPSTDDVIGSTDDPAGDMGAIADSFGGDVDGVEQIDTEEDALEEVPERRRRRMRQYKIQEVIKRRQIILVQVVKEERGNKGAALTTYISLAGRYTVLMPNTGRGGGISRKITQPQDRKRLKAIAEELEVPEGMGLIIRTAGAARTKQEIKRDYEYLLRLWESVRDMTLASTAPCLVYEEGNLIKRSIRDLYSKDIDKILVAGDTAHHEAHQFMGMLMPGHEDDVVHYTAPEPLFTRYGIERQLNAMFNPVVTLRSGGYIVINQTEALVAIDVNSGRSTREFSIEETALNTNVEAAEEIARQLKLRDLAGLIVIDFIDMEEKRNNRSVERRLKDALRHDRARIQVGRISHFGLLEMSRQRLRTGVLEGSTSQCPHCQGTGIIRSTESIALAVLRALEDQLMRQPSSVSAATNASVAIYILNNKRAFINEMEQRFGVTITVEASERMHGANFTIERTMAPIEATKSVRRAAVNMDWGFDEGEVEADRAEPRVGLQDDRNARDASERDPRDAASEEGPGRSRRRKRRRGRRDDQYDADDRSVPSRHGLGDRDAAPDSYPDDRAADVPDDAGAASDHHERIRVDDASSGQQHREWSERPHERAPDFVERDGTDRDDAAYVRQDGEAPDNEMKEARREDDTEQGTRDNERDRPRRGRRRGRRGGRARGREGAYGSDLPHEPTNAEGHDWGVLDIARPGADQPQSPEPISSSPVGLVEMPRQRPSGAAVRDDGEFPGAQTRSQIVETVHSEHDSSSDRQEHPRLLEAVTSQSEALAEPVPQQSAPAPTTSVEIPADPGPPPRKGWWQRRFGGSG